MRMKRLNALTGMVATISFGSLMLADIARPAQGEASPCIEKNVDVPMRDGVVLKADVRRPACDGKQYPVLVFRTPYDKNEGDPYNERTFDEAVRRGYAMVVQDVRGRFASKGEFDPYRNEGRDGFDTIEWAAAQSWSNGSVGAFGLSYPAATQWLAAVEGPPHLKAIVPAMCFSSLDQSVYFGGVFESAWADWAYRYMSPDLRVAKNLPGPRTYEEAEKEWNALGGAAVVQGWLPSLEMPYLKDNSPYYYRWLEHQPYDPWWDYGDLRAKYSRVKAAVLNLSGWYDEPYGPNGAVDNFLGLLRARSGEENPRTRLVLGPWIHGVDAVGSTKSGDRQFAENARIDYNQVVLDFLDYYVRGIDHGEPASKPVRVYDMGRGAWIDSDVWPLRDTRSTTYYLQEKSPGSGFRSLLTSPAPGDASVSFVSDPLNPVRDEFRANFGAFDLRGLVDRPDVLTFETEPFAADLPVVGHVRAEIHASSDAPDFDLYVKILDVAPDGAAFNLESAGQEVLRASYRNASRERKLLKPGEIAQLNFTNMLTGNTFRKGHRLRVCIMASWFPTYSRNLQTGELETVSSTTRTAKITVHTGPGFPTKVVLPLVP